MKTEGFGVWGSKLRSLFDRYKFVLVVILAGVVLLLLPSFGEEKRDGGAVESSQESGSDPFQVEELERKLEQALAQIDGVGEVRVVLTLQSGPRRILAQDSQSTVDEGRTEAEVTNVVISAGSGVEGTVTLQQLSPQFQGALVVCSGGGEPTVQLRLVEAVSALTGLGADKISVCKGKCGSKDESVETKCRGGRDRALCLCGRLSELVVSEWRDGGCGQDTG